MKPFGSLSGKVLEKWGADFIKKALGFPDYLRSRGQILLSDLDPSQHPGHHLELDGLLRVGNTCVIFEFTSEKGDPKDKVRKFTRNANLFVNSTHLPKRDKFALFGARGRTLADFSAINTWKYAYVNTSTDFDNAPPRRDDFPDYPDIQGNLYIFPAHHIEYLRQLTELIHESTRNEFLAALGFSPDDLDHDSEDIKLRFIRAENKIITKHDRSVADVFFLKFPVKKLLQIARVSRYEGIPLMLDEDRKDHYQRLLIPVKLRDIAKTFILNDDRATFPNALTVVLSSECRVEGEFLHIPKKYSSVDIIDGQHRLFAYTYKTVRDSTREKAEILATAIMYKDASPEKVTKSGARLFCEINANQAKVKNNLLYLIAYDVLGDRTDVAIAGKVLVECNKRRSSALGDVFLTNTLHNRNKFDEPGVPIVTIVDSDLMHFIKGLKPDGKPTTNSVYKRVFGVNIKSRRHGALVKAARIILEVYFNHVRREFSKDWCKNANSCLVSAKYISALIRYLRKSLFEEQRPPSELPAVVRGLRLRIENKLSQTQGPLFKKDNTVVPPLKSGLNKIYDFLAVP